MLCDIRPGLQYGLQQSAASLSLSLGHAGHRRRRHFRVRSQHGPNALQPTLNIHSAPSERRHATLGCGEPLRRHRKPPVFVPGWQNNTLGIFYLAMMQVGKHAILACPAACAHASLTYRLKCARVALLMWHLCAAAAATFPLFHPTDRPGFNSQPQCASGLAHGAKTLSSAPLPRKRIPLRTTNRRTAGPDATLARPTKCVPPGNSSTAHATRASAAATAASSAACAASTLAASASEAEITCGAHAVAGGRQPPHQQRRLAAMKGASSNCGAFPERVCLCCNQPLCASSSHQKAASETPGACAPPARACGQGLKKRAL